MGKPAFEDKNARLEAAKRYTAYLNKEKERRTAELGREGQELIKSISSAITSGLLPHDGPLGKLFDEIGRGAKPSAAVKKYIPWLFTKSMSSQNAEPLLWYIDNLTEYPCSRSYARRSYRSSQYINYSTSILSVLSPLGLSPIYDHPLEKRISGDLPEDAAAYAAEMYYIYVYKPYEIAYALDTGNEAVEREIRKIICEQNSTAALTRELISGVLMSHRSDLHKLVCDLLLAARLQEGLRQAICESADGGSREGFIAIIKTIMDNGLMRFSSVKRAVGVWLGLMTEETRDLDRIGNKSIDLIYECLTDEGRRRQCLAGEDSMEIYIALWSLGVGCFENAAHEVMRIEESGTHHQRITAYYFLSSFDNRRIEYGIFKKIIKNRYGENDSLALMLPSFDYIWSVLFNYKGERRNHRQSELFDSPAEARKLFDILKNRIDSFPSRALTFEGCVFPWNNIELKKSFLCETFCRLAAATNDQELIDIACEYIQYCSADHRGQAFSYLTEDPKSDAQRCTIIECIADKESSTRSRAVALAPTLELTAEDYSACESYLRLKNNETRQCAQLLLLKQDGGALKESIIRLLASPKEDMRMGALEMISTLLKDDGRRPLGESFIPVLREKYKDDAAQTKEKLLLESILPPEDEDAPENALYSESDRYIPRAEDVSPEYIAAVVASFLKYFPDSELGTLLGKKPGLFSALFGSKPSNTLADTKAELLKLALYIEEHKNDIIKNRFGEDATLSSAGYFFHFDPEDSEEIIPAAELWKNYQKKNGLSCGKIIRMLVLSYAFAGDTPYEKKAPKYVASLFGKGFEEAQSFAYISIMRNVLEFFAYYIPQSEKSMLAAAVGIFFLFKVPESDLIMSTERRYAGFLTQDTHAHLLAHPQFIMLYKNIFAKNDENYKSIFAIANVVFSKCMEAYQNIPANENDKKYGRVVNGIRRSENRLLCSGIPTKAHNVTVLSIADYILAAYRGIITDRALYEYALRPECAAEALGTLSAIAQMQDDGRVIAQRETRYWHDNSVSQISQRLFGGRSDQKLYDFCNECYKKILDVVLASEFARGDAPAPYSLPSIQIKRIHGSHNFAKVLEALGSDKLSRSTYYFSSAISRKETLSHLVLVTVPRKDEKYEEFEAAVKSRKISPKRLIEAALFSPEWIPFTGRYLGIPDFEQGAYYFIAHMNESFDDRRGAVIARYTHLSEDELNAGAFDRAWFESAYSSLGEKTFGMLYEAAKYITDGTKHTRARKYADACLGKYDIGELEATISDKRNKDLLMAYALLPSAGEDDIVRRYLFISKYKKDAKQFGSQRSQSETLAAETALINLAATAGHRDSMRLILRMETKLAREGAELLRGIEAEDVFLRVEIDDVGRASLVVTKGGKELKSIPAKLKKNENVLRVTAYKKMLTEQYSRARKMLEDAMENSSEFTADEIISLSDHPVVAPMLSRLVLISGNSCGFIKSSALCDAEGRLSPLGASVRIAHPYDLYKNGSWRSFQKYLYSTQTVQPFKQVFRELYLKTADELGRDTSLRYAGNQILPRKTAAVLKGRRWVADIESGLQKVYYGEGIVASIFALADWFSPSDIEAPTLEYVTFSNSKTGEPIKIDDIPDIIFSEVMRDVDLAVSVAHAGGVDPEASRSTVEMREAILSFVLPLFRLSNVRVEKSHAFIEGKRSDYTVHLGSGIVHKQGGSMIPVLPVHSAHRGRIFLPFVDDDPKTSEVISKVLLFAEDEKIKDPSILAEIART